MSYIWNINIGNYVRIICIYKSTNRGIVVTALEIIQLRLGIVIIPTISERIDRSNPYRRGITDNRRHTPRVVAVSCNHCAIVVGYRNNITLQVLDEVVRLTVVSDTTDCIFVIPQRLEYVLSPRLAKNLRTVERVGMI